MNRTDSMATRALSVHRGLTLLLLLAAAIAAALVLTAILSSPADAAPPEGKGPSGSSLTERLDALEAEVTQLQEDDAAQNLRISALEATVGTQATTISALEATVGTQAATISALEATVGTQAGKITALQTLFTGVSRSGDALVFSGMNVQVVSGTGATDGTPNGLGNLIIGYDSSSGSGSLATYPSIKTGSHYLIVGDDHSYSSYGGIVAGEGNTSSGAYASVTGGTWNIASGTWASVSGGGGNLASGSMASVSGGAFNSATGIRSSILGGSNQTVSDTNDTFPAG